MNLPVFVQLPETLQNFSYQMAPPDFALLGAGPATAANPRASAVSLGLALAGQPAARPVQALDLPAADRASGSAKSAAAWQAMTVDACLATAPSEAVRFPVRRGTAPEVAAGAALVVLGFDDPGQP